MEKKRQYHELMAIEMVKLQNTPFANFRSNIAQLQKKDHPAPSSKDYGNSKRSVPSSSA
jgi:hypothetical protein